MAGPDIQSMRATVRSYEVEPDARLRITDLFNYLQDLAGRHALACGNDYTAMFERGFAWFILRVHLEVERAPRFRESLDLETWSAGIRGPYATREFRVRGEGGDLCARGTSLWGVVDFARRRPVRIPAWAAERYPVRAERMIDDPFDKLPVPEGPGEEFALRVRRSDLDLNDHANSGAYFDWCLESVPADLWHSHGIRAFEIHYKREANWRERLTSRTARVEGASGEIGLAHTISRADDGEVLTVARSRWRPRDGSP